MNFLIRIFALLFLVLLTTNFTFSIKRPEKKQIPILLVDASRSMKPVFSKVLKTVNGLKFSHLLFFFSESLSNEPAISESYTNITRALEIASRMNPSALLLISDGNHNYGPSPHTILNNFNIPVYTFGAGIETTRDIAIDDVVVPEFVYIGDTTMIEVIVQSSGYKNQQGILEIELPSGKLKRLFPLSLVNAKKKVIFKTVFKKPGQKNLIIRIMPAPQEQTYDNNIFHSSVNVLSQKIRVQYFTSHLSFNTKTIFEVLKRDQHISFSSVITIGPGRYLDTETNKSKKSRLNLDSVDVLILDNVNLHNLSSSYIQKFLKQGGGILIIGSVEGINSSWQNILPIKMAGGIVRGKYNLKIIQPFSVLKPMDEFAPISRINRTYGRNNDAVVIARSAHLPIIAYQEYGAGIIFQINIIDLGAWQFLQKGLQQKDILSSLIPDIIRFISILRDKERLVLETAKRNYSVGTEIQFRLQSFDASLKPAPGGDFYLQFGNTRIPFYEVKKGIYETSFILQRTGKFRVYARGRLGDEILKSQTLQIEVSPHSPEIPEPINHRLLRAIADKTKGRYYPVDSLNGWEPLEIKKSYTYARIQFNHPIFAILILLLLSIDWILRRKKGTI